MIEPDVVVDFQGIPDYASAREWRSASPSIVEPCLKAMHQNYVILSQQKKAGCA